MNMTFYSGFLDDFFFPLLIYVLHHVLLLQINTSQMMFLFLCRGLDVGEQAGAERELLCFCHFKSL